jgi:hypothetical protein
MKELEKSNGWRLDFLLKSNEQGSGTKCEPEEKEKWKWAEIGGARFNVRTTGNRSGLRF